MQEWLPISTSAKGRLALVAVERFGCSSFDAVTVGELAVAAKVTTGVLYHHFGSKLGLYAFVRKDVEQRLLDRMEGAMAGVGAQVDRAAAVNAALLVGFDFAVREGFLHILGAPPVGSERDGLADMLSGSTVPASPVLAHMLAAAWRAALAAVSEGCDPAEARSALSALEFRIAS